MLRKSLKHAVAIVLVGLACVGLVFVTWTGLSRPNAGADKSDSSPSRGPDGVFYPAAAQWATAMLEEDRCNEAAYRQLMRAYAGEGRRAEALRQYQRCEQVLQAELGVTPMPETTAVFYAVLKGEIPPVETIANNRAQTAT